MKEIISRLNIQPEENTYLWLEMMEIIYRSKFMGDRIYQDFQKMQIPVEWVNANSDSRNYNPDEQSIKLITMFSSKGLEFPVVLIPGIGFMPHQYNTPEEEARLLYVAMTRAIYQLIMTCVGAARRRHRSSEFTERLGAVLGKVAVS